MATIAVAAVLCACATPLVLGASGDGMSAKANDATAGGSDSLNALRDQFILSFRKGEKGRFLSLVEENPDVTDLVFEDGNSLLGYAAVIGSPEAVRILLHRGADPDLGSTRPLEHALYSFGVASSDRVDLAEMIASLLSAGANYDFSTGGDLSGASGAHFITNMGYIICEADNYDSLNLKPFARLDLEFVVSDKVIRYYQYLKEVRDIRGSDGLLDPQCFDFFWARLVDKR